MAACLGGRDFEIPADADIQDGPRLAGRIDHRDRGDIARSQIDLRRLHPRIERKRRNACLSLGRSSIGRLRRILGLLHALHEIAYLIRR